MTRKGIVDAEVVAGMALVPAAPSYAGADEPTRFTELDSKVPEAPRSS
ncbi:hypothetical protein ABTX85_36665 [Streptomyces sp. NPDC096097]